MVLIYPRVWVETISTAMVLGLVLMLLPVIEHLPDIASERSRGFAMIWTTLGTLLGALFLWLGLNWLPTLLIELPFGARQWRSSIRFEISAMDAMKALMASPNTDNGRTHYGPLESDGMFWACTRINSVDPVSHNSDVQELSYKCKIEQESESHQVITVVYKIDGEPMVDVEHTRVRQIGRQCLCETRTIKSRRNLFEDIGFWLQDYGGDHIYGRLARASGQDSIALVDVPYQSPLVGLARFFERFDNSHPDNRSGPI
ncbi:MULTISPECIES: hypothetical protein [unclassified Ruegeria]|uniref:hypothetical protein n=1 Tax=unclassified Ruegeria TaxID=2625375 RepID=UPI0014878FD5|nr:MULTISPECIES: hypothetical protein [unclassified Ruegeria]